MNAEINENLKREKQKQKKLGGQKFCSLKINKQLERGIKSFWKPRYPGS